jgi:hypothetical protein
MTKNVVSFISHLWSWCKNVDFRVLSCGVLDRTVWFNLFLRYLVSSKRQVPPKVCYFGRLCHTCRCSPARLLPRYDIISSGGTFSSVLLETLGACLFLSPSPCRLSARASSSRYRGFQLWLCTMSGGPLGSRSHLHMFFFQHNSVPINSGINKRNGRLEQRKWRLGCPTLQTKNLGGFTILTFETYWLKHEGVRQV